MSARPVIVAILIISVILLIAMSRKLYEWQQFTKKSQSQIIVNQKIMLGSNGIFVRGYQLDNYLSFNNYRYKLYCSKCHRSLAIIDADMPIVFNGNSFGTYYSDSMLNAYKLRVNNQKTIIWISYDHTFCSSSDSIYDSDGVLNDYRHGNTRSCKSLIPMAWKLVNTHDMNYFPSMYEIILITGNKKMKSILSSYAQGQFDDLPNISTSEKQYIQDVSTDLLNKYSNNK